MKPFNDITESRYGKLIFNQYDLYVGRSLALYKEFSEGEVALFRQIVTPGMVVLDIGANIGAHTLYFAQAVGESGQVHAFEPQRIVFQTLAGNMALNSITNVFCHQQALSDTQDILLVPCLDYAVSNNFGGLELGAAAEGEPVLAVTLDELQFPRADFIKLDVEGMELQALRGANNLIQRCRPYLYVENDRPENSAALIDYIAGLDYQMVWHRPALFN
ncbi:MAG: FkbM family methyltransferase, partial [Burkholderiaceae bacterium]